MNDELSKTHLRFHTPDCNRTRTDEPTQTRTDEPTQTQTKTSGLGGDVDYDRKITLTTYDFTFADLALVQYDLAVSNFKKAIEYEHSDGVDHWQKQVWRWHECWQMTQDSNIDDAPRNIESVVRETADAEEIKHE